MYVNVIVHYIIIIIIPDHQLVQEVQRVLVFLVDPVREDLYYHTILWFAYLYTLCPSGPLDPSLPRSPFDPIDPDSPGEPALPSTPASPFARTSHR